ncbi:MFS transporter [Peristeroidobacter agariperforans]|uniref:MFS transporter n=1 Tax=Peristeroidobacter agariperforans TaxID=268404 RepID=UPI00101C5090|nr:MFS transporter [Peristeroidobacter agariperforans]
MTRSYKITLLIALYVAQGLPFGFFTLALPVLLREAGYSLTQISLLSFVALPWVLKFLWAPFLDHTGTRRAWLLFFQLASIIGALLLTQADPSNGLMVLIMAAFAFNILAASQDVITDGLAVRMLDTKERGLANAIQVGAYRFGMILGGGLLLSVFARTNWQVTFVCMAALLALTVLPTFFLKETRAATDGAKYSASELLIGWAHRLMQPGILWFAAIIFLYRFGDQMVATLLGPFLIDQGMNKEAIALMKGTVGSATSLFGALIGGWLAFSAGRRTAVLTSGIAQAASYTLYIAAAVGMGGVSLLWVATICEGVIGTMATVALFTLMMDASDPEHAGTDYTLFASLVVVMGPIGNVSGAAVADAIGYAPAFTLGSILALAGTLLVVRMLDHKPVPARIEQVWRRAPAN